MNFKPDVVLANPPYAGKAQLHQKFFNKAVEMTKDGGVVIFLQPATPYLSQKAPRKHEAKMMENVLEYKTDVKIIDSKVFKGAEINNDLAITVLHKVKNPSGKLNSITYKDDHKYVNVDLKDINIHAIDTVMFDKIRKKYENFISKNGSLLDNTYYSLNNDIKNICGLPKIRPIRENQYFSFIPHNETISPSFTKDISEKRDFGIKVENNKQIKNVYSYLKTFVARFGLSLVKTNANNHMGEFAKVPLVDFDKKWTDEMLIKELGLTKKEMKIIVDSLGYYHAG